MEKLASRPRAVMLHDAEPYCLFRRVCPDSDTVKTEDRIRLETFSYRFFRSKAATQIEAI